MNARIVALILANLGILIVSGIAASNGRAAPPPTLSIVSPNSNAVIGNGTPGLSIFFPREGALVGTDSTISFRVTNFVLVAPGGPAGVPNEGHIRVLLDNAYYADLTDDTPLHLNLKDGPHTVTLRLVDDTGQPLISDVVVNLHLTVQALAGRVTPFDATPYLALANILLGLGILAALYRKLEAR